MTLTPVEVRHLELRRGLLGYRRSHVHRTIEDIADSFEEVWRERSELTERVHDLESEVARHVELEALLRSTLVSAERAAQDMKEHARREADVIVQEAGAEGRRLIRDAIAEKEQLLAETRRVRTIMRAALDVLAEGQEVGGEDEHDEVPERPEAAAPRLNEPPAAPPGVDRLAG
jgi:cell division initiation protein